MSKLSLYPFLSRSPCPPVQTPGTNKEKRGEAGEEEGERERGREGERERVREMERGRGGEGGKEGGNGIDRIRFVQCRVMGLPAQY
jgi:hypothetical protein